MGVMSARNPAGTKRRRAWLVVVPVVIAAAVALVLSLLSTAQYQASAEAVVTSGARSMNSELEVARGSAVESKVRVVIGDEPELSVALESDVLLFTATSSNAENAAIAANTFADVYVAPKGEGAEVVGRASVPSDPFESDVLRNTLLAALLGLIIGLVAAAMAGLFDRTLRSSRQLRKVTGVPNLAMVPRQPIGQPRPEDVVAFRDPDSIEAEAYRTLGTAVEFLCADMGAKVVLVTSPRPGEGKSSVAAEMAAALAKAGRRVVLVDGDLRRPQVHHLFGLANERGLSSVLKGEASLEQSVQRLEQQNNLAVLSAGPPPPDPAELLADARLGLTFASLAAASEMVVVDAPPILPVTDPTVIAQHVDATLLVATAGLSERREWAEALKRLAVVDAGVIGTVLLSPDSRVEAIPNYHYAPTSVPEHWWVKGVGRDDDSPSEVSSEAENVTDPSGHDRPELNASFWNHGGSPEDVKPKAEGGAVWLAPSAPRDQA